MTPTRRCSRRRARSVATSSARTRARSRGFASRATTCLVTMQHASPDLLARLAMPFFCAIPASLPHDPNGVDDAAVGRPVLRGQPRREQVDRAQAKPVLQGQAAAQRRPDRLHGRELARRDVPARAAGSDRLRRRRHPACVVCRGRAEVRHQQGAVLGQASAHRPSYLAFNTSRGVFKNNIALRKAVNEAIDRRAMLAQSGFLAGKRTDQILPPGMAGFRDADLYPLQQPNIKAAQKLAQGHTGDGNVVLYEGNRGASPLRAQIIQFNLKQIGLNVDVQLSRGPFRSRRKAHAASRSTSPTSRGERTTPTRTTSSTCSWTATTSRTRTTTTSRTSTTRSSTSK